jgi:hypothetical protein
VGCHLPKYQKTLDAQKVSKLEKESMRRQCWAGESSNCSGFDKIIRSLDNALDHYDFGDGTLQFGGAGNLFLGAGIRGDIGVAMDFKGNIAILGSYGGGGYSAAGGGVGGYFTVTNAPSVNHLEGPSVQVGGQLGQGETLGAEAVFFKGPGREQYRGLSISSNTALIGPWPGEFHGTATDTKILALFNPKMIVDLFVPR